MFLETPAVAALATAPPLPGEGAVVARSGSSPISTSLEEQWGKLILFHIMSNGSCCWRLLWASLMGRPESCSTACARPSILMVLVSAALERLSIVF